MIARKIRFISHAGRISAVFLPGRMFSAGTGRFSAIFLPRRMDFVGAGRFSAISLPGRLFFVGADRFFAVFLHEKGILPITGRGFCRRGQSRRNPA